MMTWDDLPHSFRHLSWHTVDDKVIEQVSKDVNFGIYDEIPLS